MSWIYDCITGKRNREDITSYDKFVDVFVMYLGRSTGLSEEDILKSFSVKKLTVWDRIQEGLSEQETEVELKNSFILYRYHGDKTIREHPESIVKPVKIQECEHSESCVRYMPHNDPGGVKATCDMAKCDMEAWNRSSSGFAFNSDPLDGFKWSPEWDKKPCPTSDALREAIAKVNDQDGTDNPDGYKHAECYYDARRNERSDSANGMSHKHDEVDYPDNIRKGPKVITLEGVTGTAIAIYASGVQTGCISIDGDKTYTITATEEDA